MGLRPACRSSIFPSSTSTQATSFPDSARHVPVTSPTYPAPITAIFIRPRPPQSDSRRRQDAAGLAFSFGARRLARRSLAEDAPLVVAHPREHAQGILGRACDQDLPPGLEERLEAGPGVAQDRGAAGGGLEEPHGWRPARPDHVR